MNSTGWFIKESLRWAIVTVLIVGFLIVTWEIKADAHPCLDPDLVEHLLDDGVFTEPVWVDTLDLCGAFVLASAPPSTAVAPAPPNVTTTPEAASEDLNQVRGIITAAFTGHPTVSLEHALAVSWCESSWVVTAKNRHSTASGIWQYLRATWRNETAFWNALGHSFDESLDARFDPVQSSQLTALVVERDRGFRQWSCRYATYYPTG
jgi:hypothetical protein